MYSHTHDRNVLYETGDFAHVLTHAQQKCAVLYETGDFAHVLTHTQQKCAV